MVSFGEHKYTIFATLLTVIAIKVTVISLIVISSVTHNSFTQTCGLKALTMMESFYVTLPSNVDDRIHVNNTIANYSTQLGRKLVFPTLEDWEVGLAEVSYPKSWFNLHRSQYIRIFGRNHPNSSKGEIIYSENVAKLPAGHYPRPKGLVNKINALIEKTFGGLIQELPQLSFNKNNEKVTFSLGKNDGEETRYFLDFGDELTRILGFAHSVEGSILESMKKNAPNDDIIDAYKSGDMHGYRPIDLYAGYHSLYVYSDIVEYSEVGNNVVQILRVLEVPTQKNFGDQVVLTYQKPYYIPLLKREIQAIEIDIQQEQGISVPFQLGRVIVTLNFRKKNAR